MTLTEAKNLRRGQTVYHTSKKNANGKTAMRAKVTSVKTWKRTPERVVIGVKRGLYEYAKFNELELDQLSTVEPIY